jgi:hypothetical protein
VNSETPIRRACRAIAHAVTSTSAAELLMCAVIAVADGIAGRLPSIVS